MFWNVAEILPFKELITAVAD